ncbi:MAG: hypothetical protein Fur0022_46650 [Anaerolineales bacterium]
MYVLMLLRDMGLDPVSDPAQRGVQLVRDNVSWNMMAIRPPYGS